jgi:hypothetical protein
MTLYAHLPEVYVMPQLARPAPFVKSFSFPDGGQRVNGGCVVMVGGEPGGPIANQEDADDAPWSDAQIAAFLAGEPMTLGWVSQSPTPPGSENAYVCCWITIDSDDSA